MRQLLAAERGSTAQVLHPVLAPQMVAEPPPWTATQVSARQLLALSEVLNMAAARAAYSRPLVVVVVAAREAQLARVKLAQMELLQMVVLAAVLPLVRLALAVRVALGLPKQLQA
jgi:hypothetical protein